MKKLFMIMAIVAIVAIASTTESFAYSGFVESPQWGSGHQNAKIYTNGGSFISYNLYVNKGGAYIGTESGNDNISSYTTTIYKSGSFSGWFSQVYMSAAVLAPGGYASASASWY